MDEILTVVGKLPQWSIKRVTDLVEYPMQPDHRLYWLYLISAALFAGYVYVKSNHSGSSRSVFGFLKYLLPRSVYFHASAVVDYKIFVAHIFVGSLFGRLGGFVGVVVVASAVSSLLTANFTAPAWEPGFWNVLLFTIVLALVSDFTGFLNHYFHHKFAWLWPLHSVHHSAEVLTPFTLYRKHPLYDVVQMLVRSPLIGTAQGIVIFLFLGDLGVAKIIGVNVVFAVFNLWASNLRHSHIWLSFGPILDHIIISPAHHQIHHSARPEHSGVNIGQMFTFWDKLFGTFVLPTEKIRQSIVFGIDMDGSQPHPTLVAAYVEPLQRLAEIFRRQLKLKRG